MTRSMVCPVVSGGQQGGRGQGRQPVDARLPPETTSVGLEEGLRGASDAMTVTPRDEQGAAGVVAGMTDDGGVTLTHTARPDM